MTAGSPVAGSPGLAAELQLAETPGGSSVIQGSVELHIGQDAGVSETAVDFVLWDEGGQVVATWEQAGALISTLLG